MRTSSIFKSRWMALIWAAGMLWGAYEFASDQPQDDNNAAQANQVSDALNAF